MTRTAQWGDAPAPGDRRGGRRAQVLDALQRSGGPVAVDELADRLGLHVNTARFHLEHLVRAGDAERTNQSRTTPGRPRTLYRAVRSPSSGRRSYRLLAEILAGSLAAESGTPSVAGRAAGRSWGRSMVERPPRGSRPSAATATAGLVEVLDEIGFAPESVTVGRRRRLVLHHCPFLEAAQRNPEVVCAVHLGLMEGVLDELRAPVVADKLEPFVTPELCVAHLASLRRGRRGPADAESAGAAVG